MGVWVPADGFVEGFLLSKLSVAFGTVQDIIHVAPVDAAPSRAWRIRWIKSTATAPTTPRWARPNRRMCRRRHPVGCPKRPNRSARRPHRTPPTAPSAPVWQTAPPGAETNEPPAYAVRAAGVRVRGQPSRRRVRTPARAGALVGVEHRGAARVECDRSGRRRYRDRSRSATAASVPRSSVASPVRSSAR